ncbi:hypothetical protein Poli38472_002043 [Pythium oligandrum]|uniref:Uncharacterized protein n=1 Tax=Pythium oligandrum TaxID=41045 RepID=A0A8K1CJ26_PYTOL|nr:hypothetical protein Poli38472_002043 [Pythium oligandrum]|eukprot:TMW63102.1 hypothetical protein Poli38472_002043 [Pythium oligandrum]
MADVEVASGAVCVLVATVAKGETRVQTESAATDEDAASGESASDGGESAPVDKAAETAVHEGEATEDTLAHDVEANGASDTTVVVSESLVDTTDGGKDEEEEEMVEIIALSDDGGALSVESSHAESSSVHASTQELTALEEAAVVTIDEDEDEEDDVVILNDSDAIAPGAEANRRRRKRSRRYVFSSQRNRSSHLKQKRQSLMVTTTATSETASAETPNGRAPSSLDSSFPSLLEADNLGGIYPTIGADAAAWQWDASDVYFDLLTEDNMTDLTQLRRVCANLVTANRQFCRYLPPDERDDACLAAIQADAELKGVDVYRVRAVRRGRSYRELWEEEDFLIAERKKASSRPGKKRPFAGCDVLVSHHDLVHGYDDELFSDYMARLEGTYRESHRGKPCRGLKYIENGKPLSSPKVDVNSKSTGILRKRRGSDAHEAHLDRLPAIAVSEVHPAACGSWKLKGAVADIYPTEALHPAALGRRRTREGKQEAFEGGEIEFNGFDSSVLGGSAEEDEISRELNNSVLQLVRLSMTNWRRAQAVHDRASCEVMAAPLLEAETAAKQRLEELFGELYPRSAEVFENDEDTEPQLLSKPRHLVAYGMNMSEDLDEATAVGASIEYSLRLKRGDEVDVLDRNSCWNEGIVLEIAAENDKVIKFVRVSFSLWGDDNVEWITIADGRLLPRGVADGRVTFMLAPTRTRRGRLELNKGIADILERTYPTRRLRLEASYHRAPSVTSASDDADSKRSSKKQRKRKQDV